MTPRSALAVAAVLAGGLALPAAAKLGTPGAAYFVGAYEQVGRDGASPPGLINRVARIDLDGRRMVLRDCAGVQGWLDFDPSFDAVNGMVGATGGQQTICQFHNNGYNLPILTCDVRDGGRFTLWPVETDFTNTPLACQP